jgi:hypothetical protein
MEAPFLPVPSRHNTANQPKLKAKVVTNAPTKCKYQDPKTGAHFNYGLMCKWLEKIRKKRGDPDVVQLVADQISVNSSVFGAECPDNNRTRVQKVAPMKKQSTRSLSSVSSSGKVAKRQSLVKSKSTHSIKTTEI